MTIVNGVLEIKQALVKHKHKTAGRLRRALFKAGLYLQRKSMEVVPVDTNTLRSSARTRKEGKGLETAVVVSYSTDYAVYVHEDLEAAHAPGKTAKYLEGPLRENLPTLKKIVDQEMRS